MANDDTPQELNDGEFDLMLEDAQVANVGLGAQLDIYIQDAIRDGLKIAIPRHFVRVGRRGLA